MKNFIVFIYIWNFMNFGGLISLWKSFFILKTLSSKWSPCCSTMGRMCLYHQNYSFSTICSRKKKYLVYFAKAQVCSNDVKLTWLGRTSWKVNNYQAYFIWMSAIDSSSPFTDNSTPSSQCCLVAPFRVNKIIGI